MKVRDLIDVLAKYPGDYDVKFETECCATEPSGEVEVKEPWGRPTYLWFKKDWDA